MAASPLSLRADSGTHVAPWVSRSPHSTEASLSSPHPFTPAEARYGDASGAILPIVWYPCLYSNATQWVAAPHVLWWHRLPASGPGLAAHRQDACAIDSPSSNDINHWLPMPSANPPLRSRGIVKPGPSRVRQFGTRRRQRMPTSDLPFWQNDDPAASMPPEPRECQPQGWHSLGATGALAPPLMIGAGG